MPLNASMLIYNSFIDSYLRYGTMSWGSAAAYLKDKLQSVQDRIVKTLLFPSSLDMPVNEQFQSLKILDIKKLISFYTSKMIHSIKYKYNPSAFDGHIEFVNHFYKTRLQESTEYALSKPRTELGKKSLAFFGVKCWTDIPQSIKEIENTKLFSSALKNHFLTTL